MIRWYEQTLDWMIAHTSIEVGLCIFLVAIYGLIATALWIVSLTYEARPLNRSIDIWEAISKARTPDTHRTPATRK